MISQIESFTFVRTARSLLLLLLSCCSVGLVHGDTVLFGGTAYLLGATNGQHRTVDVPGSLKDVSAYLGSEGEGYEHGDDVLPGGGLVRTRSGWI
jgi:hypothetical protein